MIVREALTAFGTEMRVQLIHHYWRTPGSQIDAAKALGLNSTSVGVSVRALVSIGVLERHQAEDGRARRYTVNGQRVEELRTALTEYLTPPTTD